MPKIWDYLGRTSPKHRNLQDGLFQIASQTCNLLVQVNNTNNISFGDNTTNILSNSLDTPRYQKYKSKSEESDQVVVLIPPSKPSMRSGRNKSFGGGILTKPKLSTVLEGSPLTNEEDGDIWNHGFTLPAVKDGSPIRRISGRKGWCKPSCIPITIILLLIFLVVLLPLLDHGNEKTQRIPTIVPPNECLQECRISLVETIPDGVKYENQAKIHTSTYDIWLNLIRIAEHSIQILSTYWALRQNERYPDPSSIKGEDIFMALLQSAQERGISIKIIQNTPSRDQPNSDTDYLTKKKAASVKNLNFPRLVGRGKSSSKLWLVDNSHFFIGSPNFDWISLTQTRELGIVGYNCSCIVEDLSKIFQMFWSLGDSNSRLPENWPVHLSTKFNFTNPIDVTVDGNNDNYGIFITTSPKEFSPLGREDDLNTIINIIGQTEQFVYISLMDYLPLSVFSPTTKYWPIIDDSLKKAAIDHHIHIKMLVSSYNQSWSAQEYFLKALEDISHSDPKVDIEVRRFIISGTPNQMKIPNARINNANFMVTESIVYLGSSGWTGDYFLDMSSIGFVVFDGESSRNNKSLREDLIEVFERDWNSKYSFPLDVLR